MKRKMENARNVYVYMIDKCRNSLVRLEDAEIVSKTGKAFSPFR